MIAVDTNILVYAHRAESPWHAVAAECVRLLAEDQQPWAIPWPCIHEFIAIVTHPRILKPPSPLSIALDQVDRWLASPSLVLLSETEAHWSALRSMLVAGQIAGPPVHDARVAAICKQNGVSELLSADRDFGRIPGFAVRNPLVS